MKSILYPDQKKPRQAVLELGQYGITVNAIIPGLIDTPAATRPLRTGRGRVQVKDPDGGA